MGELLNHAPKKSTRCWPFLRKFYLCLAQKQAKIGKKTGIFSFLRFWSRYVDNMLCLTDQNKSVEMYNVLLVVQKENIWTFIKRRFCQHVFAVAKITLIYFPFLEIAQYFFGTFVILYMVCNVFLEKSKSISLSDLNAAAQTVVAGKYPGVSWGATSIIPAVGNQHNIFNTSYQTRN